jgi:predicted dehydrogenase
MLMQKCVHDIDWISYIMGQPVDRVSSFGSLLEFRPENRPARAADRCLDCPVRDRCPYDAVRIYHGFLADPDQGDWPLTVLTPHPTPASVDQALRHGPYGDCVYLGRNDVVDHQVVSLEFPDGANASFTVAAFTTMANRQTRIFGTRGSLEGDGSVITVHDFVTGARTVYDTLAPGGSAADGHGGGDEGVVAAFVEAVRARDQSLVDSDVAASLQSLQVVWAAEQARREGTVVTLASVG